jgi:hypothetical protein
MPATSEFGCVHPGGSEVVLVPQSHPSPFAESVMPLPHFSSDMQSALQPSPEMRFPSSHTSPGSTTPLPHDASVQTPWKQRAIDTPG